MGSKPVESRRRWKNTSSPPRHNSQIEKACESFEAPPYSFLSSLSHPGSSKISIVNSNRLVIVETQTESPDSRLTFFIASVKSHYSVIKYPTTHLLCQALFLLNPTPSQLCTSGVPTSDSVGRLFLGIQNIYPTQMNTEQAEGMIPPGSTLVSLCLTRVTSKSIAMSYLQECEKERSLTGSPVTQSFITKQICPDTGDSS